MTTVMERINQGTTEGDHHNHWPDKLEIVNIEERDVTDPLVAYDFGFLMGLATGNIRGITDKYLPREVRSRMGKVYAHNHVWFTLATARGQRDDPDTRNIWVLIPPQGEYDFVDKRRKFVTPGLIVELGCKHDFDLVHGNCWTQGTCKLCGNVWEIDSSG